jgi:hypothetical protein
MHEQISATSLVTDGVNVVRVADDATGSTLDAAGVTPRPDRSDQDCASALSADSQVW